MVQYYGRKIACALFVAASVVMFTAQAAASGTQATGSGVTVVDVLGGYSTGWEAIDKAKWYADWLRDNLGMRLTFREYTGGGAFSQIFQNQLASRQMTNILTTGGPQEINQAVNAGLLLNLDNYKDKLPHLYSNPIYANMIKYNRKNLGNGTGLYALNLTVGQSREINFTPTIRYDLYERLGSPKLETLDDLIPLLKRMMELEPVSESGRRTYGYTMWPEWDGNQMSFARWFSSMWGGGDYLPEIHIETTGPGYTGNIISILDDNSLTKKALKWFFKANQAGILDPDSATQSSATAREKYTDGAVFFSMWAWIPGDFNTQAHVAAANPKGYAPVLSNDMVISIQPDYVTGKKDRYLAVGSSNTRNLDTVLAFVDHLFSWEGCELVSNLPEGALWEKGPDGKARVKASAWQYLDNNEGFPELGNSLAWDAAGVIGSFSIADAEISPITGRTFSRSYWPDVIAHGNASNKISQRWSAANNNAQTFYDLVTSTNKAAKVNFVTMLMPPVPQDIETISTQIGDVLKTNCWKMVFAANEAEFEALWQDARQKAGVLGMQKILDWAQNAWAVSQAEAADYR
jgi:hypothetical protein